MKSHKTKIVIVDDNEGFRKAVKFFLETELECKIIGEVENGNQFLITKIGTDADIILMDINMPVVDGYKTTKQWQNDKPNTKVIALTMFSETAYLDLLVEAGFKGFVLKSDFYSQIENAITTVLNGGLYFKDIIQFKNI